MYQIPDFDLRLFIGITAHLIWPLIQQRVKKNSLKFYTSIDYNVKDLIQYTVEYYVWPSRVSDLAAVLLSTQSRVKDCSAVNCAACIVAHRFLIFTERSIKVVMFSTSTFGNSFNWKIIWLITSCGWPEKYVYNLGYQFRTQKHVKHSLLGCTLKTIS